MGFALFVQHYTRLYSLRLDCSMVSFTAAKTNLMFSVSEKKLLYIELTFNLLNFNLDFTVPYCRRHACVVIKQKKHANDYINGVLVN